jgi:hypothetical protein
MALGHLASSKKQLREVRAGGGHGNARQTHLLPFGLGTATAIDGLQVRWLGGTTETITGAMPRDRYRVVEGSGKAVSCEPTPVRAPQR